MSRFPTSFHAGALGAANFTKLAVQGTPPKELQLLFKKAAHGCRTIAPPTRGEDEWLRGSWGYGGRECLMTKECRNPNDEMWH